MALYISNNHVWFYLMDTFQLTMFIQGYFPRLDDFVIIGWIRTKFLSCTYILLGSQTFINTSISFLKWSSIFTQVSLLSPLILKLFRMLLFCHYHIYNSTIPNSNCLNKLFTGYSLIMSGINKLSWSSHLLHYLTIIMSNCIYSCLPCRLRVFLCFFRCMFCCTLLQPYKGKSLWWLYATSKVCLAIVLFFLTVCWLFFLVHLLRLVY